jgi:hypothetical protein
VAGPALQISDEGHAARVGLVAGVVEPSRRRHGGEFHGHLSVAGAEQAAGSAIESTPACTHPAHYADAASAAGESRASAVPVSIPVVLTCPTGTTHARDEMAWPRPAQDTLDPLERRLDVFAGGDGHRAAIRRGHVERVDNGAAER